MARRIDIETLCNEKGLRITEQRRVIARVLSEAEDHPDVEALHERASAIDSGISIATVYRTVRLFEEAGILERHDFGDGRARYEAADATHHDHLIDVETGNVIEFVDDELEALQRRIAEKLGFASLITAWSFTASRLIGSSDVGRNRGQLDTNLGFGRMQVMRCRSRPKPPLH
jgi:Fur family ferric uptake transcriptional regulator